MGKRRDKAGEQPESIKTAISRMLELPEYSLGPGLRIEINSNREAVVESCRGILEYTPERVRLLTAGMTVRFTGRGLSIGSMSRSSAVVSGVIEAIEFSALG